MWLKRKVNKGKLSCELWFTSLLFFLSFFPRTKGLKEKGEFCELWMVYVWQSVCAYNSGRFSLPNDSKFSGLLFFFSFSFIFYGDQIWFCFLLYITLPRWVIVVVLIVSVFQKTETEYNGNFLYFDVLCPFLSGILMFGLIGSSLILIRLGNLALSFTGPSLISQTLGLHLVYFSDITSKFTYKY